MTPRQRVRTALQHRQPDRTPYHITFTRQMHARMADYLGDPAFLDHIGNHFTILRAEPAGGAWRFGPTCGATSSACTGTAAWTGTSAS